MSQQSSNKQGVRSPAKKESTGRQPFEPRPDSSPDAGAFGSQDRSKDWGGLEPLDPEEAPNHKGTHSEYEEGRRKR